MLACRCEATCERLNEFGLARHGVMRLRPLRTNVYISSLPSVALLSCKYIATSVSLSTEFTRRSTITTSCQPIVPKIDRPCSAVRLIHLSLSAARHYHLRRSPAGSKTSIQLITISHGRKLKSISRPNARQNGISNHSEYVIVLFNMSSLNTNEVWR